MDVLRAAAILMVILAHSILSFGAPTYLAPLQLGGIGVDLFFVLSGWLLGNQLFKEFARQGTVDVKRFWVRRWMRTLPAYYAVLSVLIVQQYVSNDNFTFPWSYLIFTQNYNEYLSFFSISWSLCVEEQFYLIIAPSILLLTRISANKTTLLLSILLITPFFLRLYTEHQQFYSATHVQVDCCIMGVLLAQLYNQQQQLWQKLIKVITPIAGIFFLIFVALFAVRYFPELGIAKVDNLLLAFLFGSWVILANKDLDWQKKLSFPGANYIATRSYGMYLLHPEMLTLQKKFMLTLPFGVYFIISVIGSALLSEVLYRIIEKPVMDVREKYQFSKSIS